VRELKQLAQNPPHSISQLDTVGGRVCITFPSAFHFVMNSGSNVTEAVNFSAKDWEFYMKKTANCERDLKETFNVIEKRFKK
jgi:hypothetical protein